MFKRIYPRVWPFVFLGFGLYAVAADGHPHFQLFGRMVDLHVLMWFVMALAHADVLWNRRWSAPHGHGGEASSKVES